MAHIQRGDTRQYIQREAQMDFSGAYANMLNQGVQQGVSITQKANESTMANNQIELSTRFLAKNNEINTKYQADPTNPQREVELQEAFDSLANEFKINPVCEAQWNQIKNNVYGRYKVYNAQWQEKQQQSNISTNLKNGYEALTNQISMLGLNGASVDEMRLIYANGIEGLRNGAVAGLGEMVVDDFLKDSNHDIMTTYISALALNNPLEAQRLLADEGVRNDIGNAGTIEKLETYTANSLSNQSKRNAVAQLGNTLRNMNGEDADAILNGEADLNRVMKFIESNKNLPEGSKDLILDIYGIGSKSEYVYDRDKKKIVKKEESGSKTSSGVKLTDFQKKYYAEELEQDLHNLISFSEENAGNINVKDVKKNKKEQEASNFAVSYLERVAEMQGQIDAYCNAGAITKDDRKRLMNSYITPVVDYLESNLNQLDEGNWKREKLGYGRIAKQFSTEGLKKQDEIREVNRQKLFAQNYYLDELNQASQKLGLKNIYEIESLKPHQQREIYELASERALVRAKRWTDKPEIFFAKEFPEINSKPFLHFKQNEAVLINRAVAEAVYKREFENLNGTSKIDDLKDYAELKSKEEIKKQALLNRRKAGGTLDLREREMTISRPSPRNLNEFYQRVKALGVTPEQFMQDARERGFLKLPDMTMKERWHYAHLKQTGQIDPMAGYYDALREAEHAKALQDAKKRNRK
ncbi:hypothetical protein IJD34_04475 [bacterium]|nr:hypothetical protein [bacterium]